MDPSKNPAPKLDTPAGTSQPADAPVIHTIPEQFYGGQDHGKPSVPTLTSSPAKSNPPQPPPKPPAPPRPTPKSLQKKPIRLYILLGVIVAALLLGVGLYFFVFKKKTALPVSVCGDKQCTAGETTQSCPGDCAPQPFCGDNKCEPPETQQTCAADCRPLALCGDNTCDTTESPTLCPADCKVPLCGDNICDANENFSSCPADCPAPPPKPGKDTDSDGLSDLEERSIYQTDAVNPDSDNDSFVDLNEVLNLFDPAKFAPAMLETSAGVSLYVSPSKMFTMMYPRAWTSRETSDASGASLYFTTPTSEFIQVAEQQKSMALPLSTWYAAQVPTSAGKQVDLRKTKQGYPVIFSSDLLTAYLDAGSKVFILTYNLGTQTDLQYQATFQMMVHSVKVKVPSSSSSDATITPSSEFASPPSTAPSNTNNASINASSVPATFSVNSTSSNTNSSSVNTPPNSVTPPANIVPPAANSSSVNTSQ